MNAEGDLAETVEVTDSALEPPPRPVEELTQLLGVKAPSEVLIGELEAKESAPMLDVHEETRNQLHWKPRYFAESRRGTLRIKVTRLEAQELTAAGATTKP
jgi:hypothetical protein